MLNQSQVGNVCEKEHGFTLAVRELNNKIDMLTGRLEILYRRIEPLLTPAQPANPNSAKGTSILKPAAILEIDSASERLAVLAGAVDECISRLEI